MTVKVTAKVGVAETVGMVLILEKKIRGSTIGMVESVRTENYIFILEPFSMWLQLKSAILITKGITAISILTDTK